MPSLQTFFKTAQDSDLPFVVYRKPGEQVTKAYFQKDSSLSYVKDYTEEGFVFAPFDAQQPAILFPIEKMDQVVINDIDNIENLTAPEAIVLPEEQQAHKDLIQKGIDAIRNKEMEKVVLSRKQNITIIHQNPYTATLRLLLKYPRAFVYCWCHPQVGLWLGATPETLLTIKNRQLETMSLAGTQAYSGTMEVTWGEKEKREQELVTQAIINNLSPLLGSSLKVEGPVSSRAGNLVHLKTKLTASLDLTKSPLKELIQALHPTPAICGFPRAIAKSFIMANEGYDRSFYTGYLGELNMRHTASRSRTTRNIENQAYKTVKRTTSLYVNLRCMQWQGNQARIYVGGGITEASSPEKEWEETVNKLQTMHTIL